MIQTLIILIRVRHWVKNFFIFLPLLFAGDLVHPDRMMKAWGIFFAFSFVASAIYAFNDVIDAASDRLHVSKKHRPVASGEISPATAMVCSALFSLAGFWLAWMIQWDFVFILFIYLLTNLVYSFNVKHMVILDVMFIAAGYIYRLLAGASVSSQSPSHWILLTTFFLSLFLGFAKRRVELASSKEGVSQRVVLNEYSLPMLDHMLAALMAITVLCYSLYSSSDYVQARFHTDKLIYTVPFVLYGVFHYFQKVHMAKHGEDPVDVLLKDKATMINLVFWALLCIILIYY